MKIELLKNKTWTIGLIFGMNALLFVNTNVLANGLNGRYILSSQQLGEAVFCTVAVKQNEVLTAGYVANLRKRSCHCNFHYNSTRNCYHGSRIKSKCEK